MGRVRGEWTAHERLRLVVSTAVSFLLVVSVVILALPGAPRDWSEGFETALQKPAVLIPLMAAVATTLLWSVRTWVLRRRLREPGPIRLMSIEDATVAVPPTTTVTVQSNDGAAPTQTAVVAAAPAADRPPRDDEPPGAPVARLAMHLRQLLSELELTAPTAMPGRPMTTDFVELLGTTKLDFKQPLAVVGKLLRIVLPTHAYEVSATLLRRDLAPQQGVSIEVTVLPRRHTTFRTFWADTWEEALGRATSAIGALVVPLSKRSERGPWCTWHGKTLDDDIFDAYQKFQHLSRDRRCEEAMAALYAALRRDPANHYLRFQLGLLEEELALYLDALLTYHSIRQGLKERIQAGTDTREHHAFERLELLARYRATMLLGWGERLAEQWVPAMHARTASKRAHEITDLRDQLRPILLERYSAISIGPWDLRALGFGAETTAHDIKALLSERPERHRARERPTASTDALDDSEKRRRRREVETRQVAHRRLVTMRLRLLFQLFALHDVRRFLTEYTDQRVEALDTEVTPVALRLLPTWARVRAHTARHALYAELKRSDADPASLVPPVPGDADLDVSWPPPPETIRQLWADGAGAYKDLARALDRSKEYLDHYNAACSYAVALLRESPTAPRHSGTAVRGLAAAAVAELEIAVRVGGSDKIASQWDWILKEDPDLAGLRAEPEFRRFESERFPSSEPSPVRPSEIVKLVAARHSARLCSAFATRFEQQWHLRADGARATNPHDALRWWEEEREAWRLARELSQNHRHWQTRLEVIQQMQLFSATYRLGEFSVPQPAYADERIDVAASLIDKATRRELQYADDRIRTLDQEFDRHGHDRFADAWERYLQRVDMAGGELDQDTVRRLAVNRASAWGEIRVAFSRRLAGEADCRAAKRELVAAAGKLAEVPVPLPHAGAVAGGRRRLLVIANRTLEGPQLRTELLARGRRGTEIHILAPMFALNDHYDTSDTELELERARARLCAILDWAHAEGIRATGTVGDPNVALGAIADELTSSGANEVLVATLPRTRSNWLRNGIVARLETATDAPVSSVVIDLRVHVTVDPRLVGRALEPMEVVPTAAEIHSFLKEQIDAQVFEPEEEYDRVEVGVVESPDEVAATIREKLTKERSDGTRWVGVTVTADDAPCEQ